VIIVMIATTIITMTDATIIVARTTTTAKTTTARSGHLRTTQRGQPQWCIPECQPRDQLHRRWSPSN
jgi:hypothetical protein